MKKRVLCVYVNIIILVLFSQAYLSHAKPSKNNAKPNTTTQQTEKQRQKRKKQAAEQEKQRQKQAAEQEKQRQKQAKMAERRKKQVKIFKELFKNIKIESNKVLASINRTTSTISAAHNLQSRASAVNAKKIIKQLDQQIANLQKKISIGDKDRKYLLNIGRNLRNFINSNPQALAKNIKQRRLSVQGSYESYRSQDFATAIGNQANILSSLMHSKTNIIIKKEAKLQRAKEKRKNIIYSAKYLLSNFRYLQSQMRSRIYELESLLSRAKFARMPYEADSLKYKIDQNSRLKQKIHYLILDLTNSISSLRRAYYTKNIMYFVVETQHNYDDLQDEEYYYEKDLRDLRSWIQTTTDIIVTKELLLEKQLVIAKTAFKKTILQANLVLDIVEDNIEDSQNSLQQAINLLDRAEQAYADNSAYKLNTNKIILQTQLKKTTTQFKQMVYFLDHLVMANYHSDVDNQNANLKEYIKNTQRLQPELSKATNVLNAIIKQESPTIFKAEKILTRAKQLAKQIVLIANVSVSKATSVINQANQNIQEASNVQRRANTIEKPNIAAEINTFKNKVIKLKDKVQLANSKVKTLVSLLSKRQRPEVLDKMRLKLKPLIKVLKPLAQSLIKPSLFLQNTFKKHLSLIVRRENLQASRQKLLDKATNWLSQLQDLLLDTKNLINIIQSKTIAEANKYFKHINTSKQEIKDLQTLSENSKTIIYRVKPILQSSQAVITQYATASLDEIEINDSKKNQLQALESKLALNLSQLKNTYAKLKPLYNKTTQDINWRACVVVENKSTAFKKKVTNFFKKHIPWNDNGRSNQLSDEWMYLYNCKDLAKYTQDTKRLYNFADQYLSAILYNLKIKDNLDFGVKFVQKLCSNINIEQIFEEALEDLGGGECSEDYEEDDCDIFSDKEEAISEAFKQIQSQAFSCSNLRIIKK